MSENLDPTASPPPAKDYQQMADGLTVPVAMNAMAYRDYGDPSVLQWTRVETPRPAAGQVLIRVSHTSVNPIDYRLRKGEFRYLLLGKFPRIPGFDVAGEIISAPPGSEFRCGDRVMAFMDGGYGGASAQYAACSENVVAKIPDSMPMDQAAAIPLAGTTALQSLKQIGKIKAGDRVLINGASGGVGTFAVQIALACDAVVTGVASGTNEQYVRELGVEHFLDYHKSDFESLGQQWDIVFDASGQSSFSEAKSAVAKDGIYISTEPDLKGLAYSFLTMRSEIRGRVMLATPEGKSLRELIRLYEEQKLKVSISESFPLQELANAHRLLQRGIDHGKVVLHVES